MGRSRFDVPRVDEGAREDNKHTGPLRHLKWLQAVAAHPGCTGSAPEVAIALTKYLDNESGSTYRSIDTLAEDTGLNPKTIIEGRRRLIEAGLLLANCSECYLSVCIHPRPRLGPGDTAGCEICGDGICLGGPTHAWQMSIVLPLSEVEGQQQLDLDKGADLSNKGADLSNKGAKSAPNLTNDLTKDLTGGRGTPNVPMVDKPDTTDSGATNQIIDKPKTPPREVRDESRVIAKLADLGDIEDVERRLDKISQSIPCDQDQADDALAAVLSRQNQSTRSKAWSTIGLIARCYAERCGPRCRGTDTGEGVVHGQQAREYHKQQARERRAARRDDDETPAAPRVEIPEHLEAVVGWDIGQRLESAIASLLKAHRIISEFDEFDRDAGTDRAEWTPEIEQRWQELYDKHSGGPHYAQVEAQQHLERIGWAAWAPALKAEAWRHYLIEVAGDDWQPDPEHGSRCWMCSRSRALALMEVQR